MLEKGVFYLGLWCVSPSGCEYELDRGCWYCNSGSGREISLYSLPSHGVREHIYSLAVYETVLVHYRLHKHIFWAYREQKSDFFRGRTV